MLLSNGSAIKQDVIDSFNRAVEQPENIEQGIGTTDFWNFVEADMYCDLKVWYNETYIGECFDVLADNYENV
jgi:hypothetical protein